MSRKKIAIIDSGLDHEVMKSHKDVISYVSFVSQEQSCDETFHGTKTFNLIDSLLYKNTPEYHIVRIFGSENTTTLNSLKDALEYVSNKDIDIINLSLSISAQLDNDIKGMFRDSFNKLQHQGKVVVCSVSNSNRKGYSFPAMEDSIIGVNGGILVSENTYWYNNDYRVQAIADATPRLIRVKGEKYDFISGNSKAAALITCNFAKLFTRKSDKISRRMTEGAAKEEWEDDDFDKIQDRPKRIVYEISDDIRCELKEFITRKKIIEGEIDQRLWSNREVRQLVNCFELFENHFDISIKREGTTLWEIESLDAFSEFITNYIDGEKNDST